MHRPPASRHVRLVVLSAALLTTLCACGSRNVQVFQVSIVNDTRDTVVVRDCDHYCSSSPIAIHLQPGGSTPINRDTGSHKEFSITTDTGAHVGCLDLYYRTAEPGARVPVSNAVPCTGHARPLWKTTGLVLLLLVILGLPFLLVLRR